MSRVLLAQMFSLIFNTALYATGGEMGNGGDVVYCKDNGGSFEVLDHWESRAYLKFDSALDQMSGDYMTRAIAVAESVKSIFPEVGNYLIQQLKVFEDNRRLVDGVDLLVVPDAYPRMLPKGCELKQIANQREPMFPGEQVFLIDNDLWTHLDAANRATLVLHEIIYRYALNKRDATNSILTRYLVGYFAQKEFANKPRHLQVFASQLIFNKEPGSSAIGTCPDQNYFWFNDLAVICRSGTTQEKFEFHSNGMVKDGFLFSNQKIKPLLGRMPQTEFGIHVRFSESGNVSLARINGMGMTFKVAGDRNIKAFGDTTFFPNKERSIKRTQFIDTAVLLTTAGDERHFSQDSRTLEFDENGYVIVP